MPIGATGGTAIELTSEITIKARKVQTVSPNATGFKCFELMVIISALVSTLFATFQISFKADIGEFIVLTYLVYAINIIRYVFDRRLIKRKYLRTKFIFDIISLLPLDLIALAVVDSGSGWAYDTRLEKINRMIRFYIVINVLQKYEDRLGGNSKVIRSIKYGLVGFTIVHLMACGWYTLACPNESRYGHTKRFQCKVRRTSS